MTKIFNKLKNNKLLMKLSSVLIICVVLCSMLVVPSSAAEDPREALVGKTFYFIDQPSSGSDSSALRIYFVSSDIIYSGIRKDDKVVGSDNNYDYGICYYTNTEFLNPILVYHARDPGTSNPKGWLDSSYRYVTVTGYYGAYDESAYNWFLENTISLEKFKVNGTSFSFFEGDTWSSFVDSDFNSGSFTIDGDNVLYEGYRLDGVKASDLIEADRNYSFPPTASYFMTVEGVVDWVMAAITDSVKIFYVEGQGLTLVGILALASLSISIAFLLIGVISNFLKNRG